MTVGRRVTAERTAKRLFLPNHVSYFVWAADRDYVSSSASVWSTSIVGRAGTDVSSGDDRAQAKDAVSTQTPNHDNPLERVGRAVADRRVELGLETQRDLADAAGVSLNTAALLERGKSFPHRTNRIKFEDALQWPRGTLDAVRRGGNVPEAAAPPPSPRAVNSAPAAGGTRTDLLALTIATAVAAIAATCTEVLVRERSEQARETLRKLDDQLLQLESVITAILPHLVGTSWSETMSAAVQLHEYREVIRDAAQRADTSAARRSGGVPGTKMASAKS